MGLEICARVLEVGRGVLLVRLELDQLCRLSRVLKAQQGDACFQGPTQLLADFLVLTHPLQLTSASTCKHQRWWRSA